MITITKHGKIECFAGRCQRCECEFTAQNEDKFVNSNGYDQAYCPECGLATILKPILKEKTKKTEEL